MFEAVVYFGISDGCDCKFVLLKWTKWSSIVWKFFVIKDTDKSN